MIYELVVHFFVLGLSHWLGFFGVGLLAFVFFCVGLLSSASALGGFGLSALVCLQRLVSCLVLLGVRFLALGVVDRDAESIGNIHECACCAVVSLFCCPTITAFVV